MIGRMARFVFWKYLSESMQSSLREQYFGQVPKGIQVLVSRASGANYFQQCFYDTGILFIHIPKVAGTAFNMQIYGKRTIGHLTAKEFLLTNPTLLKKNFSFAILRNPWDRAVSSYEFARNGGSKDVIFHCRDRYENLLSGDFEEFVRRLSRLNLDSLDPVFHPQVNFVLDDKGAILVNHLGKVEELDLTTSILEIKMEKNLLLKRVNESNRKHYSSYYKNAKLVDLVGEIYKNDVILGNYEYDDK